MLRRLVALSLSVFLGMGWGCASARPVPRLASLSLEEKAGQVFMAWILSGAEGQVENRARLLRLAREGVLGGVILSTGTRPEAAAFVAELQAAAKHPLLIAADFECGLSLRLRDAPHLGTAMLLGATGSEALAHAAGRATGAAGAALGFHLCFGPVLDVNNNPANPIINVRSFGEDPKHVARLGAAFVRGVEQHMAATGKHFPGHGDVDADSHLVLPRVWASRERLQELELVPFRAAIDAGASAIMTAHLSVPALDARPRTPATVSGPILTGLLRGDLGFGGLIVTDALEMGGVQKVLPGAQSGIAALRAGADVLLMPPDATAMRDAVVAAVRSGRLSERRLDAAVERILGLKRRFLTRAPRSVPRDEEHRELGRRIAERGLTLVRDARGIVPLSPATQGEVLVVNVLDAPAASGGAALVRELKAAGVSVTARTLHPKTDPEQIRVALEAARKAKTLVVGLHVKVREFSGKIGLPPVLRGIADVLVSHPRGIAVAFGNPYLVRDFSSVAAYLCAFDQGPVIETAVARALSGRAPITGRLPISIPGVAPIGAGLSRFRWTGEARSEQGFAPGLPDRIRSLLEAHIAKRAFPGAVVMVTRRGEVVAGVAAGRETYAEDAPSVGMDTRYDLASLTKVCATLPALAVLLERGVIGLEDPLAKWVPEFQGAGKAAVTIRHAMVHSTGLPAYIRFFRNGLTGKQTIVRAAARTELSYAPGSKKVYSDLGLILLMAAVERASGQGLEAFVRREVYEPLGVAARFTKSGQPIDAAPTEEDAWRGRVVRGEVHDENAFAMGGTSGHAGLFGRAADVARLGNWFLGGGAGLVGPGRMAQLVRREGSVPGSSRALLFDTFRSGGSGGHKFSARAFGHTGFTGTSLWCDPESDVCVVLLTNRVHPTRANRKIQQARRELHDLILDARME